MFIGKRGSAIAKLETDTGNAIECVLVLECILLQECVLLLVGSAIAKLSTDTGVCVRFYVCVCVCVVLLSENTF